MSVTVSLTETTFSYTPTAQPALRDATFTVAAGEIAVFFGPNGSGKSTAMKLISGLLKPYAGTIALEPQIDAGSMVYLHQDPYVLDTTVRRNIEYPLKTRGIDKDKRRRVASEWIERMELAEIADTRARALSGGQKQQVCIARTLVAEPDVVFLDEPTAHVDRAVRERLSRLLAAEHQRRGLTLIIATHDHGFGFGLGDRFYRFDDGAVREDTINVLEGSVVDRTDHVVRFAVPGGPDIVAVEHPGHDASAATRAVFSGEDLLLSASPIGGSALNEFTTTVANVACDDGRCRVTLDCGYRIDAVVTERSHRALEIDVGKSVFVALKASSVQLY